MKKSPNKKVIRRDNEKGKFTTIHHSILYDKRITSNAKVILISILSDADTFNLSYELLLGRFGLAKNTTRDALKNLEDCGYLRRDKRKRGQFYTISEYGNLKTKEEEIVLEPAHDVSEPNENPDEKNRQQLECFDKQQRLFEQYLLSISTIRSASTELENDIIQLVTVSLQTTPIDFYVFKAKAQKLIDSKKKEIYKLCFAETASNTNNSTPKAIKAYSDWLKEEIFDRNVLTPNYKRRWIDIKAKYYKPKADFETDFTEKLAEMREDGDDMSAMY